MLTRISAKAAHRLSSLDPNGTVFAEFTALAIKHKSVNLGQGFPTLPVAPFILQATASVVADTCMKHQYTRSEGHIRLVNALASFYTPKLNLNRNLEPLTEIMTTVGASEAIYSTVQAFIGPGDEVILMQPFYDCYPAAVTLAGGIPKIVNIRPSQPGSGGWKLDLTELNNAVNSKTKAIIINNPHNPVGKVWSREELLEVAKIAKEYDLLVIADEVYETLVFSDSPSEMIKFASLPDMWERTITVGSIGKMFGITGWKIGWTIAPAEITRAIWLVHQFLPFTVVTPLQEAGAISLEMAMDNRYFEETTKTYEYLRDKLFLTLEKNGLRPCKPSGGYFIVCVIDPSLSPNGEDFSKWLTERVGVTAIPLRAFFHPDSHDQAAKYVRFAFCKEEGMLDEAEKRISRYFAQ